MKVLLVVCALVAAAAASSNIDWSKVRPITELPRFQKRFPQFSSSWASSVKPTNRIVGGQEATPGQFPYQVGLLLHFGDDGTGLCGGSIIHERYILTAAHCVDDLEAATVIMGAHNMRIEEPDQVIMVSDDIILHEEWTPELIRNDVALIRLPQAVTFSARIQPIRLPASSFVVADNTPSTISGFGRFSDEINAASPTLNYVNVPILADQSCRIRFPGVIQESNICTDGSDGMGACSGDSGGPLTVQEGGESVLVGAVSFGLALGCERGWPSVFARITSFRDWISVNAPEIN